MNIIEIIQVVLAALLIIAILFQQRGTGLSGTFGGESSTYSTRRGMEKILFSGTIVVAILFFGISVVKLLL
ncbi:MAG: preprotein translocase subunit SecG [Candidatus Yanofskybacteria bacterium RIFCSPLOWO2_01_FULL_49_25]|uniref:Protein-export membrane protein SecG n=1 Tax=Candidatus Yanofskybacteria bacterium RIFCSPLOWO2_01_FULL_49_25 TaxID=1802701 RepID=A0A1F8GVY3_9BACT|nr:MAG: preprotein translocase subunit SecG [Candidatus Yanofskybacteria bacterium RIFCSPLOWO2_01_FULL_49_25]